MQFQACTYKTSPDSRPREGIAKLNSGFDTCDVDYIVDGETGHRVLPAQMHNYNLSSFPLSYIDTSYVG